MFRSLPRTAAALCAVAAVVLLTGAPDFMALQRAASTIFLADTPSTDTRGASKRLFEVPVVVPLPPRDLALPASSSPDLVSETPVSDRRGPREGSSPASGFLLPLYASFLSLQALDVHSTLRAIDGGAAESNPLMAPFTGRPAAFVALKAGTSAGILYMTERVRRRSPLAAVVMMAAFNSVYATVVANNYRVGNQSSARP